MAAFAGLGKKPYDFQRYAAGNKLYGSGRSYPTSGPVDPLGYRERDAMVSRKRNAMLRRMQAQQKQKYMSSNWLRGNP